MDKWLNQIIHGDCLEVTKDIPDKSVDLVLTDPPYNISKAEWDKWKRKEDYIEWMGQIFKECERLLKDNGSFYFFHNDMMRIKNLMQWLEDNTKFVFKQFIVWNKRFEGASNKGFLDGFIEVGGLRNYQQMAEYCLFYTSQDEEEGSQCLRFIQDYLEGKRRKAGLSYQQLNDICGYKAISRKWMTDYKQPRLIQREDYEKIKPLLMLDKSYDDLMQEYNLRKYTFSNQKTHHSVWNYEIAPKLGHITPKPVAMIENIIKHSSNEGDIILDPFLGSGTTAIAAHNTGRFFIGIEKEPKYVEIARKRLEQAQTQQRLFAEA